MLPSGVPTEGTRPPTAGLPEAAEPKTAAAPTDPPPGQLVPVGPGPEGIAIDVVTRRVAVATRNPDALVLLDADTGAITGRSPLPGSARHVALATPGGPLLVPVENANALIRVALPQGTAATPIITGTSPHDAAAAADGTVFVSNELGGTVTALHGERIVKVFTDAVQPAGLAAVDTTIGMLDARANTLTVYDASRLSIIGSTQAGTGLTHLVADRHGRMIAADTRGDTIRVFTPLPKPQQVGSVAQPGGPYGIAYDAARDRLWVASSGTNEVIGYDMTEPIPRQLQRFPTVQNPYSLAVDETTGRLFVAGVNAGVVQIINTAT
jgi:DNA-binding beta-propeller fold protein YncE